MKAFIENKNGVYDTTMTPENSGYYPGAVLGGYEIHGKAFYNRCINGFVSVIESKIAGNVNTQLTVDDWKGIRFYLWRQHTSGTIGADDEHYLIRELYG